MFAKLSQLLLGIAFISASLLIPASASAAPPSQEAMDIVDTAAAAGNFTTLVTAVEAAGLVETLKGEGPFTVFAPTDAAFAALPEGTLDTLLQDPEGVLKDILLYHVAAQEILAVDLLNAIGTSVEMANGQMADITVNESRVLLHTAGFVATDIATANGIIHVIDAVMVPVTTSSPAPAESAPTAEPAAEEEAEVESEPTAEPAAEADAETEAETEAEAAPEQADAELPNIVEAAVAEEGFSTLVTALQAAELVDTLQGDGPFTVFAPTNDAFAALPEGTLDQLLAEPTGLLADILLYHVVPGKVMAGDVVALNNTSITTALGQDVSVAVDGDTVMINDATVIATDIETSNGVIHVIDTVLLPPLEDEQTEAESAPEATDGCSDVYYVQRGDTLAQIATRYGVGTAALARANGIPNANIIYTGQRICITH